MANHFNIITSEKLTSERVSKLLDELFTCDFLCYSIKQLGY
jgi:hypothetical protein